MKTGFKVAIEHIAGICPQQAEGTVDGRPFYWRVRHGRWELAIADDFDGDPVQVSIDRGKKGGTFLTGPIKGGERGDLGHVDEDAAIAFIARCAALAVAGKGLA